MSFAARFHGYCDICTGVIRPGDELTYDEDAGSHAVHAACVDKPEPIPAAVCTECFMAKAANGECGCDA